MVVNKSTLTNHAKNLSGLTINDLNKYLPAILTVEDIKMSREKMAEGLYLTKCIDGLKQIPNNSIDLIIADPPEDFSEDIFLGNDPMTLQDYYSWNIDWLKESHRILKSTGAIYLLTNWYYSSMYHSLLNNYFNLQSRITWHDPNMNQKSKLQTWRNVVSDIWFATKSDDFQFKQEQVVTKTNHSTDDQEALEPNLWTNIPRSIDDKYGKPVELFARILKASSFKLNWILDPFMRIGSVGLASKKYGRRFIGFETNKDKLLLAMKRIDQEKNDENI